MNSSQKRPAGSAQAALAARDAFATPEPQATAVSHIAAAGSAITTSTPQGVKASHQTPLQAVQNQQPAGSAFPQSPDAVANAALTDDSQQLSLSLDPSLQASVKLPPAASGLDMLALEAAKRLQRKRLRLLSACEPLLLVNHESLSLPGYPNNEQLEMARRRRDLWLLLCGGFFLVFLLGLLNLANALIAGVACGALACALSLVVPQIRRLVFSYPSYSELLTERRESLRTALNHINLLEGKQGLAHHFAELVEYNGALRSSAYLQLMKLSAQKALVRNLRSFGLIRLYQQMLIEAESAFERLKEDYLERERAALDISASSSAADEPHPADNLPGSDGAGEPLPETVQTENPTQNKDAASTKTARDEAPRSPPDTSHSS